MTRSLEHFISQPGCDGRHVNRTPTARMDLIQSILRVSAEPFCHAVRSSDAATKGLDGSWSMLHESSQLLSSFPAQLENLVAATYPRPPNMRSALDQVRGPEGDLEGAISMLAEAEGGRRGCRMLQRLLCERPQLAGCVVRPVLLNYCQGRVAAAGAQQQPVGKQQQQQQQQQQQGQQQAEQQLPSKRKRQQRVRPGGPTAGAQVDTAAAAGGGGSCPHKVLHHDGGEVGEGGDGSEGSVFVMEPHEPEGPAGVPGGQQLAAATEAEAIEADAKAADDLAVGGEAGQEEAEAPAGEAAVEGQPAGKRGAAAGGGGVVGGVVQYDNRQLPVSWLLQYFGGVSEPLQCLLPQQRSLRAHVLAAAAAVFATEHRKALHTSGDGSGSDKVWSYIPGSPVVRFVRDCFAATPLHARMQLLADAISLTSAAHTLEGGVRMADLYGECTTSEVAAAAAVQAQSHDDQDEECEAQRPEGNDGVTSSPRPTKRQRRQTELAAPMSQKRDVYCFAIPVPPYIASPSPSHRGTPPCRTAGDGGGSSGDNGDSRSGVSEGMAAGCWGALLTHICEDEEPAAAGGGERAGARRHPPTDPRVISPLVLTELLMARGDLFGPADVQVAAACMLRCLAALLPAGTAALISRVLDHPGACAITTTTNNNNNTITNTWHHVSPSSSAAQPDATTITTTITAGGGLVAALAVLRQRRSVDWRRGVMWASGPRGGAHEPPLPQQQQQQQGKKRGRGGSGKKAADTAAMAAATAGPLAPMHQPAPLTGLWVLSHVLPVLLRPLSGGGVREGAISGGGGGGGGVDGVMDDASSADRALACLSALIRHPHLLLPEDDPEELPVATQVLALHIRKLTSYDNNSSDGTTTTAITTGSGGGGSNTTAPAGPACTAERQFAAVLLDAVGLGPTAMVPVAAVAEAAEAAEAATTPPLVGPGLALLEASRGVEGTSGTPSVPFPPQCVPSQLRQLALTAAAVADKPSYCNMPGDVRYSQPPPPPYLWPVIRPLLGLLEHLPPPATSPIVAAIEAILLTALMQRRRLLVGTGVSATCTPSVEKENVRQPVEEAGEVATRELLTLLTVADVGGVGSTAAATAAVPTGRHEAAAAGSSEHEAGGVTAAVGTAVRLAAPAIALRCWRLVVLAAEFAACSREGVRKGGAMLAGDGMWQREEEEEEKKTEEKEEEEPVTRLVTERLGASIAAVAGALAPLISGGSLASQPPTGLGGKTPQGGSLMAAAASTATVAAAAGLLVRVDPGAVTLVRLSAVLISGGEGGAKSVARGIGPGLGMTPLDVGGGHGSVVATTTTVGSTVRTATTAARSLVCLLRRSPLASQALRGLGCSQGDSGVDRGNLALGLYGSGVVGSGRGGLGSGRPQTGVVAAAQALRMLSVALTEGEGC